MKKYNWDVFRVIKRVTNESINSHKSFENINLERKEREKCLHGLMKIEEVKIDVTK